MSDDYIPNYNMFTHGRKRRVKTSSRKKLVQEVKEPLASKAMRKITRIARNDKPELKYYYNAISGQSLYYNTLSEWNLSSPIGLGNTKYQRNGNEILIKSFKLELAVRLANTYYANTGFSTAVMRIMVVRDRFGAGGAGTVFPSGIPIFLETLTSANTITSPYDLDYLGKGLQYQILCDRKYTFDANGASGKLIKIKIRNNRKCRFDNIPEPTSGTCWLYITSDVSNATAGLGLYLDQAAWTTYFTDV